ncbi:MAG: hypothetical protein M3347_04010 [Armatimonadota bacterium]|nr:hypothetical protein [Armatimonadota bacterium]
MNYLLPLPDATGIAQTKQLFWDKYKKAITDEQAADILGRVMKHLYLTSPLSLDSNLTINPTTNPCFATDSMPENPKKTKAALSNPSRTSSISGVSWQPSAAS